MASISPLLSAAGIKSLVKIQVSWPPCGDGPAPSWPSAPPTLSQLHGEMQVGCWEGRYLFCLPAVGKEDVSAAPKMGPGSSCHSEWTSAHFLTVVPSFCGGPSVMGRVLLPSIALHSGGCV